jgi:hypothetical protein
MTLMIRMRDRMPLHPAEPLLAGSELDRAMAEAVTLGPKYEEAVRQQFNRQFTQAMLLAWPKEENA